MILIDVTTAVGLYSAVLVLIIGVIWVYTEVTVRRTHRVLAKQFLWRCVFCGYSYLDENAEDISRCPRCESFNSVGDKRAKEVLTSRRAVPEEATTGDEEASIQRRNPSHRKRPHQKRRGGRRRR